MANFGEQIKFLSVKSIPSYVVTLKVQYEIRSLHEGVWPYEGKSIFPSRVQLNNKNEIWSVNLPLVDDFSKAVKNYSVTEKVATCDACGGHGKVHCSSCGGHGELTCSTCNGRARIACSSCNGNGRTKCNRCWGQGSIKGDSSINYREITCPSCGGQRFVFCSSCGGSGARDCPNCTNGRVVCNTCMGSGVLICGNCKGAGQLIYCLYLKDRFTVREGLKSVHHDFVPTEIRSKIAHYRRTGELVAGLLEKEINKDIFRPSSHGAVKRACETLLDQAKDIQNLGVYLRNYRILKEDVGITKIKVAIIEYEFSGKAYKAWVYGEDQVWAPVSPVSDICEKWFSDAQEAFKKKEYSIALDSMDKVIEMFDKGEHKKFREKISRIINIQYLSGAIIGGSICPVVGNILGIMIGLIFKNAYSNYIRTSRRRFFSAFWTSFVVSGFLSIILSIILFAK